MVGYENNFIGVEVPLPTFKDDLDANVLKKDPSSPVFDAGIWRKYIHYSVATNMIRRQPICVALNVNQKLIKSAKRSGWSVDDEIGEEYQLNNDYYRNNDWDRGHMARRSTSAWGETDADAKEASDATMLYTNSCMQHANLNQDEWLKVEDWVKDLQLDSNDKISVFSGPIYGLPDLPKKILEPVGRPPAEIPAGFYKVVVFLDKDEKISTRAFIYPQDAEALKDKRGKYMKNYTSFQVSTKEIEEKTGLIFPEMLRTSNPMKEGSSAPVNDVSEIINDPDKMPDLILPGGMFQIFIAAALINAPGRSERGAEWVSLANYSSGQIDLDGWTLSDSKRKPMKLSGSLVSGETTRLNPLKSDDGGECILVNSNGVLTLKDPSNNIVDRVEWTTTEDGEVTVFSPP